VHSKWNKANGTDGLSMNLIRASLIVAVAAGIAVAAMLLVRRNAPDGGYFNDGDRASGVFGVLAAGFSVLLGFIERGKRPSLVGSASSAEW
jgi:hypothetical protein